MSPRIKFRRFAVFYALLALILGRFLEFESFQVLLILILFLGAWFYLGFRFTLGLVCFFLIGWTGKTGAEPDLKKDSISIFRVQSWDLKRLELRNEAGGERVYAYCYRNCLSFQRGQLIPIDSRGINRRGDFASVFLKPNQKSPRQFRSLKKDIGHGIEGRFSDTQARSMHLMSVWGIEQSSIELKDLFKKFGLSHLLVVSGMHLGFLWVFIQVLLWPLRQFSNLSFKKWFQLVLFFVQWALIAFYIHLMDYSTPLLRAGLMGFVLGLMNLMHVRLIALQTILCLALVFCIIDPDYLTDLSFLMSFLAVIGIIYGWSLYEKQEGAKARGLLWLWNKIKEAFWVGIFAQLGIVWVLVLIFGRFAFLGVLISPLFSLLFSMVLFQSYLLEMLWFLGVDWNIFHTWVEYLWGALIDLLGSFEGIDVQLRFDRSLNTFFILGLIYFSVYQVGVMKRRFYFPMLVLCILSLPIKDEDVAHDSFDRIIEIGESLYNPQWKARLTDEVWIEINSYDELHFYQALKGFKKLRLKGSLAPAFKDRILRTCNELDIIVLMQ